MTEKEYWLGHFESKFKFLRGKRIAVYGTGINARAIVNSFPEYKFICLVDDHAAGKYVDQYYVMTFQQMLELEPDCLIIAAKTVSAEVVYKRISLECRAQGLKVYNLYGMEMQALHRSVMEVQAGYGQLTELDLQQAVSSYDVIAFDVDHTLFTVRRVHKFDFYWNVEHKLLSSGIDLAYFADKFLKIKDVHPDWSYRFIVENIVQEDKLEPSILENIWDITFEVMKEEFLPRAEILNVLKYAVAHGKEVCLIEDMAEYRIQGSLWLRLLAEYGVQKVNTIFCSSEYLEDKYGGLFREICHKYPEKSYLHIGDEMEADILVPRLYGIDTFLVKSPKTLFLEIEGVWPEMLQNRDVRETYEDYLIKVYHNVYRISEVLDKRERENDLRVRLNRKIDFCKCCECEVYDSTVIYTPVIFENAEKEQDIECYQKLVFSISKNPLVSIIIPVYNQFEYTYNCLKSILNHSGHITYEVIVADDCSADQVCQLEKVVSGITVLHNKKNLRFINNCNYAAGFAKGEYLLFLNNDTQVQPDWLEPLVRIMLADKKVGMTGSKLVYANGCLQEAGGIVWKDGSAWNFGNGKNPTDPEFSYVKEADYISGAALMIRTSLWKEIGGFDQRFAPAYYEDTDLAYEVRRHGYKVVFQPASIVVHFEGVSNGIDISQGLKNYQVVNQKKFYEKWEHVLKTEHFENGKTVYLAKDRGHMRKQILVVDHYIPNYDKDAGGRCTYMYLKAFVDMGMKVTFIGDNFSRMEPYASELNQLGIEVLWGDYYCLHWEEWVRENLKYFDYVYLQRPHIAVKYVDLVKKYGHAKIFYFAHDLQHIRLYREYELTGNEQARKEADKWKKIEMALFEKADVGHVVGTYEQKLIQEKFPDKPIRNIPLYIYDHLADGIEKDFTKRKDILFVGGFNHKPNIDAVLWFADSVFPVLLEQYPEMIWYIVGSNPPAEIRRLANANIVVEGFVSDQKLEKRYRQCRIVVVPLRYGAGLKGKIVEAAYFQIPVVTTDIGGEGFDATVGSFVVENDAGKMAELIGRLYMDYELLKQMSDMGSALIQKYFMFDRAKAILAEDMF